MEKTTEELSVIAKKISKCFEFIEENITPEEVNDFLNYCTYQETVMPLFNPSMYMSGGNRMLEAASKRGLALRAFFKESV